MNVNLAVGSTPAHKMISESTHQACLTVNKTSLQDKVTQEVGISLISPLRYH